MLIILLVAFGALVAAGVPLVLGATAVAGTVGLLGPVSQVYALAPDVAQLVVIIGLAVGVDYAMFYSRRMMEERDNGPLVGGGAGDRGCHLRPRRAHLGPDGDDGDGRAAVRRQPDLHRVRHRHDARRRRHRDRLADLPARDALLPRAEELAREGPRALRHRATSQDQGRVTRLGRRPDPRPQAPARVGADRRRRARRALRSRPRPAVQGARFRGLLAQPAGHPDLRPRPGRLPRRRRAGDDRGQGRRRHGRAGAGRDPAPARRSARQRPALRALRASRSARTRPSPSSRSRSRAAAPTRPPNAHSRSCGPRSSRPPSASSPGPRSP